MDHSPALLPEHSGWRSADQRLLADIPRCLMSPLGFHWLANERLVQRHWTDKNKVTCLASDEDFFFPFPSLVVPRDTNDLGSSAARHLIWLWTLLVLLTFWNAVHPLSLSHTSGKQAHTHICLNTLRFKHMFMLCFAKYPGLCLQNRIKQHLLVDRYWNCSWLLK